MKRTLKDLHKICVLFFLVSIMGCSDSSDSKDNDPSLAPTPVSGADAAVDCNAAWKTYVSKHPKGLILSYRNTSEIKKSGDSIASKTVSDTEEKVLDSSESQVVLASTTTTSGAAAKVIQNETSKVLFLERCNAGVSVEGDDTPGILIEESPQEVVVPAGNFNTNYKKLGVGNEILSADSTTAIWVMNDGSNILVKSETIAIVSLLGTTSHTLKELVKVVSP